MNTSVNLNQKGFQVIELIIFVILFGVLLLWGTQILLERSSHRTHEDIVARVYAKILLTRRQALHQSRAVALFFQLATGNQLRFRPCYDRDGDGVTMGDIENEIDICQPWISVKMTGDMLLELPSDRLPAFPPSQGYLRWTKAFAPGRNNAIRCNTWGLCTSGHLCWTDTAHQRVMCLRWIGYEQRYEWWVFRRHRWERKF